MPKTVAEVFKSLALKAGAKEDDEQMINELSAPDFARMTITDELNAKIENGLLSIEQAKNNHPDVKKHYFAAAYNGLDSELNALMEELQLPVDVKNVILNERSSTKRAGLLAKKVKELESAKKNTDDKGEKTTLQNEITDLRGKLRIETDKLDQIKTDYEGKISDIYKQVKLNEMLTKYKTTLDDFDPDVRNTTLSTLINKTLQDKNAEFKMGENGQIVLIRKDGANVFGDDNRQLTPQTLIDQILSQNKILKVSDQKTATTIANAGNNSDTVITGNNGNGNDSNQKKDLTLKNAVSQSMKDLENAAKVTSVM